MSAREPRRPLTAHGVGLLGYQIAAATVGLLLIIQAVPEVRRVLSRTTPWDLNIDRLTARAYLDGYSPFTPEGAALSGAAASGPSGNGHPPTTSFWVLPIATLAQAPATVAMDTVTVLLLLIELMALLRILRCPAPFATAWLVLGYILGCAFMLYHLSLGQWSGIIGFFFAAGWWAGRKRDDWLAGIALGCACTLKLFPGVVVLMFLVTRRWRVLAAAAASYLAVAAIMTARFGLASWPRFLAQQSAIADQWMGDIQNQSLHGIAQRLFTPVCVPHGPVVRAGLVLSSAVSAVLIGTALWWARRTGRAGAASFDLTYALFVALSVVTSQWTWEHYTIIYLLPAAILAATLIEAYRTGTAGVSTAAMLLVLAAVVASWRLSTATKALLQASVLRGNLADHFQLHVFDILNWAPGLALLALLFVTVAARYRDGDRDRSPVEEAARAAPAARSPRSRGAGA